MLGNALLAINDTRWACTMPGGSATASDPGVSQGVLRLQTLAEVIDRLGADGKTGDLDGTEIRVRPLAAGRKDRGQVHLRQEQAERGSDHGHHGQGRPHALLQPHKPGSCADITHAR
ncbi:hypothetical protein ACWEV9_34440 [Streptomyces albogriseolus]|uniref:hypothetical protein n=1 Tax=Streptomyces albogriseolus group TaxID=2867120 RepID=UPI00296F209A